MTEEQIRTDIQNVVRKHLLKYLFQHDMRIRHLAIQWGISETYLSGIIYNKNNFKIATLIEIGLRTGCRLKLSFEPDESAAPKTHEEPNRAFSSVRRRSTGRKPYKNKSHDTTQ